MNDSENKYSLDDYGSIDLTIYGGEPVLFPGFGKNTRLVFFIILLILGVPGILLSIIIRLVFHILGLVTNTIHIIILTRRSMRNNSINVILMFMAINDICITIVTILTTLVGADVVDTVRFTFLTKSKFGYQSCTSISIISSIFCGVVLFLFSREKTTECRYGGLCEDFAQNSTDSYRVSIDLIGIHDTLSIVISLIIPATCYPFLTISLARELRKAEKSSISSNKNKSKDSATRMIIIMTILFMFAEIPQAIGATMTIYHGQNSGFFYIGKYLTIIFNSFTVVNASLHCYICYKMSTMYKTEFRKVFRCNKKIEQNKIPSTQHIYTH